MNAMTRRFSLAVLAVLMILGCDHGGRSGQGSLVVRWQVKGNTCAQAGLASVQVTLLVAQGVVAATDAACEDGEAVFDQVESGLYDVRVDGLDGDGAATYSVTTEEVAVTAGDPTVTPTLELTKVGAGLSLSWYFENNGLCSFNGVTQVDATVWYNEVELHHQVYGCDPFAEATDPLPEEGVLGIRVPDLHVPDVDVVVFGLDRDGFRRFSGARHVLLHEGRVVNVSVPLKECDGPCG